MIDVELKSVTKTFDGQYAVDVVGLHFLRLAFKGLHIRVVAQLDRLKFENTVIQSKIPLQHVRSAFQWQSMAMEPTTIVTWDPRPAMKAIAKGRKKRSNSGAA